MTIREYSPVDEKAWLHCRVVAFLDCSYCRDVKTAKEAYVHPAVSLVAEENDQIVGLIELELDSDELVYPDRGRGAILWHMAVLPEYRRTGIAKQLWQEAKKRLIAEKVHYCELWTQEDEAANRFYQAMGFVMDENSTWLRCRAEWDQAFAVLDQRRVGEIYGAEEVVFQAAPARRKELDEICTSITEVRLYTCAIN